MAVAPPQNKLDQAYTQVKATASCDERRWFVRMASAFPSLLPGSICTR